MEEISITREDFNVAVAKAVESTTKDPKLADMDHMFILMLSMYGMTMCRTVGNILFDEGSQDE